MESGISNPHFFLIDVFSDKPLSGNPLAVVTGGEDLTEVLMQHIAREFNQSETTFILPPTNQIAHCHLRSFTPDGSEVFGAGHNALGAWWWLAESGKLELSEGINTFIQEIGQHKLPVDIEFEGADISKVAMTQASPRFKQPLLSMDYSRQLANALGLRPGDLDFTKSPPQVVSTGAAHLLVPIQSREAITRIHPKHKPLATLLSKVHAQGCYAFCLEPVEAGNTAHARFFNPTVSIWEDPATGSAAGPLASYLVKHGIVSDGTPVIIEQGYVIQRPSKIYVDVSGDKVRISGRAVTIARGELFL